MILNQPIDILVGLLNKWSIENIISIDDGWKKDVSEDNEILFNLLLEKHIDISDYITDHMQIFEDIDEINVVINLTDLQEFVVQYEQLKPKDRAELDKVIVSFDSRKSEFISSEESLSILSRVLQQLVDVGFNVKTACQYSRLLRVGQKGRTLWLLDKEIRGNSTRVFEVLESVIASEDVALIVTNDDTNLSTRSQISEFVSTHKKLATSFLWVLRKDQIDTGLTISVKCVLQGVTLHNTLKIYNEINNKAEQIADEKLRFLEPEDLNTFFKSSYSEGSQMSDTLLRIRRAVMSESMHDIINNEVEYSNSLLANRELLEHLLVPNTFENATAQDNSLVAAGDATTGLSDLTQEHKVVPIHSFEHWDFSINTLASCIFTGDLFAKTSYNVKQNKWTISKTVYLLITQPCDTVVRKIGTVIERGAKVANLIKGEFLEYGSPQYQKAANKELENKKKIHFVRVDGKYGMVNLDIKNIHQIDFRILDLCSLDNKGEAVVKAENLSRIKYMSAISKKYYEQELRQFIMVLSNYQHDPVETYFRHYSREKITIEELKEAVQKEFHKVTMTHTMTIPKDIVFVNDKGFSLTRIARLKDEYILNVIRQSTEYQGRQALPGLML